MRPGPRARSTLAALSLGLTLAACGSTHTGERTSADVGSSAGSSPSTGTGTIPAQLLAQMRPIGVGPRFHPAVRGRPTGGCDSALPDHAAHIELFGADKVVLIPAGVGRRGRCDGNVVTTDPTGIVHFRAGATLADLFRAWGHPLSAGRMASFRGRVRFYLDGRPVPHVPALTQHAEIVIEVGPYVPPHRSFSFPPGL